MTDTPRGLDPELLAVLGLRPASELDAPEGGRAPAPDDAGEGDGEVRVLPWSTADAEAGQDGGGPRRRTRRASVSELAERSRALADAAEEAREPGEPRRRRASNAAVNRAKEAQKERNQRFREQQKQRGKKGGNGKHGTRTTDPTTDPTAGPAAAPGEEIEPTPQPSAPSPELGWADVGAPPAWAAEGELPERVTALLEEWDAKEAAAAERIAAGEEVLPQEREPAPPPEPLTDAEAEQLARAVALRLLSAMPRTRHELSTKMLERDVPPHAVTVVLDRFEEVGLVDDAAFARAWVESRRRSKGYARGRLAQELRRKGVAPAQLEAALEGIDEQEERERCEELALKKLGSRPLPPARYGPDRAARDKVLRRVVGYLARKGFAQGTALAAARAAMERHDAGER